VSRLGRRVIHLASGREWRGGQNQVLLLARALAGRPSELEQVVVTGRRSLLAQRLAAEGIPVRRVGWRAGLSPAALAGTIREAARGPALIHAHDAHALTIAGVAGIFTGTPYLATRRVDFPLRRPGLWRRAERIIAISEAVRRVLLSSGIPPERVVRVHSGIDLEAVRRTRSGDIRAQLRLPESGPLAVAVGAVFLTAAALIGVAFNAFTSTILEIRTVAFYLWMYGGFMVVLTDPKTVRHVHHAPKTPNLLPTV